MFTIEDVNRWFPPSEWGQSFNYGELDDALGNNVVNVSDGDYQGTTRILLERDGMYAIHRYSWGSCSGCDFAQGCTSAQDYLEYANYSAQQLVWMTASDMLKELSKMEKENESDRLCVYEEDVQFIRECRAYLEGKGS